MLYNSDPEVVAYGMRRLALIMPTYFICGLMDVMVGALRGIGYSLAPMIVSIIGACVFRILWVMTVFAAMPTLGVLMISYPVSWTLTFAVLSLIFARKRR